MYLRFIYIYFSIYYAENGCISLSWVSNYVFDELCAVLCHVHPPPPWFPTQGLTDAKEEFQHWTPVDNCVSLFWREWPYFAFFYSFITLPGRCHLGISWMNYCTFSIFTWVRVWRVLSGLFFFFLFFLRHLWSPPNMNSLEFKILC